MQNLVWVGNFVPPISKFKHLNCSSSVTLVSGLCPMTVIWSTKSFDFPFLVIVNKSWFWTLKGIVEQFPIELPFHVSVSFLDQSSEKRLLNTGVLQHWKINQMPFTENECEKNCTQYRKTRDRALKIEFLDPQI